MNGGLELDTIDDKGLQKYPYHSEIEPITKEERDAQVLARLGKKSVLEVHWTVVSSNPLILIFFSGDSASSPFWVSRVLS